MHFDERNATSVLTVDMKIGRKNPTEQFSYQPLRRMLHYVRQNAYLSINKFEVFMRLLFMRG